MDGMRCDLHPMQFVQGAQFGSEEINPGSSACYYEGGHEVAVDVLEKIQE